jgi:1-acyl-sn-glycerol-3-phosphate acyltransferase
MLKTIFWFIRFGLYMIGTFLKAIKLSFIKKNDIYKAEEYSYLCARKWAKFCAKSIGVNITVIGKEKIPEGACLFVGNHQGYFDVPLVLSQIDKKIGFVAKKELEGIPILSKWMREIHCVFMDRSNPREAIKSINEGADYLKKGYSMAIFPEGTRSKSDVLGEFKKGSMKLGLKAAVPIVPITVKNTYKVFEEKKRIRKADVQLIIGNPIYINTLSKEDQNNLTDIIKNEISIELKM